MKMAYMRKLYMGTIGDLKTLERHYALMAEKGWMIDKIGLLTHRYRAIEPCKKRFFVDLLPQITAFDYPENEDAQDYRSICEESGWSFVTASKQFHVFCADEDAAPPWPIHTDDSIQANIYLKAFRKYELFSYMFVPAMLLFLVLTQLFNNGVELFLSNLQIFSMIGYFFFFIGYGWMVGFAFRWYLRAKKAAKLGLPMPKVNYHLSRMRGKVFAVGAIAFVACMLSGLVLEILGGLSAWLLLLPFMPVAAVGVGLWTRRQIDTKPRERKANRRLLVYSIVVAEAVFIALTGFVVSRIITGNRVYDAKDERPGTAITLQDIGVASPPGDSGARVKGSVAVPIQYSYWEVNRQGNVHTEAYRAVSKALALGLYNRYAEELRESRGSSFIYLSPGDAAYWGAEEGAAEYNADGSAVELILLRGKALLRLSLYKEGFSVEEAVQAVLGLWEGLS